MEENNDFILDIEQTIKAKLGETGNRIPRFVYRLIGKIIHVDYLNGYFKHKRVGVDFCKGAVEYIGFNVIPHGLENLPDADENHRYTFVSNHPLGGVDGIAVCATIGDKYDGKVKYLLNDFLMAVKGLAPIGVPINKTGRQSRNLPALINEAFNTYDQQMMVFPAGLCSRKIEGKIQDVPWNKTFIVKSVETHRDVVPIYFEGRNSNRFYRVATLCKKLKLKFNFAMVLLPDEMVRSKGNTYNIVIGKPIPWQTFDNSRTPAQWAAYVREKSYELAETLKSAQ